MSSRLCGFVLLVTILFICEHALLGQAKTPAEHQHGHMPGMNHPEHQHTTPAALVGEVLAHESSGTSVQPEFAPLQFPMPMEQKGPWMLMVHGQAFLNFEQQSGPRGDDKIFSTNWFMLMGQRSLGSGQLTLRTMLSLEPATVTHRLYPELFQQGETAFGRPINDGQHPHDFLMEIAALYDLRVGEKALFSVYAAPVGDPALGPVAYPHRNSAMENPIAPLGHHLEDSTHIASDVVTGGFTWKLARLETSGFHGREPDEDRWDLDSGKIDSWSTRLTVQPTHNWTAQYSFGHLTSPEALHPLEDLQRMTASVSYDVSPGEGRSLAVTFVWGRNHSLQSEANFNGYLAEASLRIEPHNFWARIENVDRTTELLLGKSAEPAGFEDQFLARIQAYTIGYDHELPGLPHFSTAVGGQVTFYHAPSFLKPVYGSHPTGAILFVRIRPVARMHRH
jgi:hypothetical protein